MARGLAGLRFSLAHGGPVRMMRGVLAVAMRKSTSGPMRPGTGEGPPAAHRDGGQCTVPAGTVESRQDRGLSPAGGSGVPADSATSCFA